MSTQLSESPPSESPSSEFQELAPELFKEPPQLESLGPPRPRSKESRDDFRVAENFPHLDQNYKSPPTKLPKKKRKPFQYMKSKLLGFFPSFGL